MSSTRREFLVGTSTALAAVGAVSGAGTAAAVTDESTPAPLAGTPPVFGTSPEAGPPVNAATLAQAQKLVQIELTPHEREQAAGNWRSSVGPLYERRVGPRKVSLEAALAPGSQWAPFPIGRPGAATVDRFVRSPREPGPLPARDADIAFAPLSKLSRWIERRELTSERLTRLYLARLEKYDAKLRCVITPTPDLALRLATAADREIAAGRYKGPLHGIPWGAKDLLDTADIRTTYGAEPFRDRVPAADAEVVRRLHAAGAVLVAKLSLGALALNDVWFGGQTMNPWLLEEGSGGSSAGPAAATAAGLVGFAIGSETEGQYYRTEHALWSDRLAADLRPRPAHRRNDAMLVFGQARADDTVRRRHPPGTARNLGPGCRGPGQCPQRPAIRCGGGRAGLAEWATFPAGWRRRMRMTSTWCPRSPREVGFAGRGSVTTGLAVRLSQYHFICRSRGRLRGVDPEPSGRSIENADG